MAYPIIILGAGASRDYALSSDNDEKKLFRPPVTSELFDMEISDKFLGFNPEVSILASRVINETNNGEQSMEECLTKIKNNKNEKQFIQLIGLQFYLQDLFREISNNYYRDKNNYKHLIDVIRSSNEIRGACIVNFNYDLLLERELPYHPIKTIDSLIRDDEIKVIKIHGAYNWGYVFKDLTLEHAFEGNSREFIKQRLQELAPLNNGILFKHPLNRDKKRNDRYLKEDQVYKYMENVEDESETRYFSPAVAVPLTNKSWVCPDEHTEELKTALEETDRILIIGWSANDSMLLDLIKQKFEKRDNKPIIYIVSADEESAIEIKKKMKDIIPDSFIKTSNKKGFAKFMGSEECDKFFSPMGP